jgi:hypothetical protein
LPATSRRPITPIESLVSSDDPAVHVAPTPPAWLDNTVPVESLNSSAEMALSPSRQWLSSPAVFVIALA